MPVLVSFLVIVSVHAVETLMGEHFIGFPVFKSLL